MLRITVDRLGQATVLQCRGRIVVGDGCESLRQAVLHTRSKMLVLDLACVDVIDAGGLGILLELRQWATSRGVKIKLINVTEQINRVLQLTGLDRVFEFCTVVDWMSLLCCAANDWERYETLRPSVI